MATVGSMFSNFFGGAGAGGLEHSGGGKVTPLPAGDPREQLTNGGTQQPQKTPEQLAQEQHQADPLNSHLEGLAGVWKTATTADGKPIAPQADPLAQPLFNFKNDDVIAAAKKLDFTSQVNPELAAKALSGDAGALQEYVNGAIQTAFAAMTLQSGSLLNDGFARHGKAFDAALPTRLRNHEVATRQSDDPVLSHPAVAPIIMAMKATISQQQPQLSPAQVQAAAENYVKGLGSAMNLQEQATVTKKKDAEAPDWLAWANLEK